MRSKTYILPINPIAWKRAGANHFKKRFFDQQAQDKVAVGLLLARQHNDEPLFSGPTRMITYFGMPLYRTSRFKHGDWHTHTPDFDNLAKFLCDAMKKICISDDRIICWAEERKVYDKEPHVRIELTDLSDEKASK